LETQSDDDEGVFGNHLRHLLDSLRWDAALCEVVSGLLRGEPCTTADSFYRLRSAGVVVGNSAREAKLRCQLYANYLSRHLL
jgi:AAA-like domain